jgi:hypothetical protein
MCGAPEPHKDFLHCVFCFAPGGNRLERHSIDEGAEAFVEHLKRGLFISRDPTHQVQISLALSFSC